MLTLTRLRPAARRSAAQPGSRMALVVSERSVRPWSAASRSMKPTNPLRTSGSPPVTRTLVMPAATAAAAKASSSS